MEVFLPMLNVIVWLPYFGNYARRRADVYGTHNGLQLKEVGDFEAFQGQPSTHVD
jgi:hypothetical protein